MSLGDMTRELAQITVASLNPVKINAALAAFGTLFPRRRFSAAGLSVPSGVADQPMSLRETIRGARNRAEQARAQQPESDFWIGIEGGIEDGALGMACFARVHVLGRDGTAGLGQTAVFYLPREVATLVRGGLELGDADDRVFGRDNSKQASGAIGLLTDDLVDRQAYYTHAVIMALLPFKNRELSW